MRRAGLRWSWAAGLVALAPFVSGCGSLPAGVVSALEAVEGPACGFVAGETTTLAQGQPPGVAVLVGAGGQIAGVVCQDVADAMLGGKGVAASGQVVVVEAPASCIPVRVPDDPHLQMACPELHARVTAATRARRQTS